ncbi:MAG: ATP-binding protein [Bryobacteraceae bacterium]|nr:ATP-binding protein [Bryobacteraceae bacterium]
MASYERTFCLQVPSSTENLALIREFVAAIGEQAGFSENETARLALAVDEACTNVIEHAYENEATHEVTVRVTVDEDEIVFEVIDRGKGFDPTQAPVLPVEELIRQRRSGGLGLRLIRSIMDDVQYRIVPGEKNELKMIKKRRAGGAGGADAARPAQG